MADNVTLTNTKTSFDADTNADFTSASDDVSGVQYQRIKVDLGADGAASPLVRGQQTSANSIPVVVASDNTVAVSAASLPLPSGAATSANQSTIIGHVDGIETVLGTIDTDTGNIATSASSIDGKITACNTGAVVVSSSALPSGASTAAKQPALGTAGTASTDVITVQGIASMTALKVDGSAVTQPVSLTSTTVTGTVAVTQSGTWDEIGINDSGNSITVDNAQLSVVGGGTEAAAMRVTIANDSTGVLSVDDNGGALTVDGTITANAGSGTFAVGGTVATNVAITANPMNLGAQAVSSENTAVTTARQVQLVADLVGKLIVLPYANPENFVSGTISSAMTGTTSTSLIAAPAAGLRNYITQITVSNSHATVGTDIIIQDGSGGTTLYVIPAAAVYGGAVLTFPTPLRQPTTATAIYCANVTTGSSTKVSASGYKGV